MTDHDAAPVEQFLDVSVAQWEAVVQPDGVLDDEHGETVAVGLGVGHGQSAYPDPVKATQPPNLPGPHQCQNLAALDPVVFAA